jgi:hypothetical protein
MAQFSVICIVISVQGSSGRHFVLKTISHALSTSCDFGGSFYSGLLWWRRLVLMGPQCVVKAAVEARKLPSE